MTLPSPTEPELPIQSANPVAPASQPTSAAPQTWKPGDVANGHVLTAELKWVPVHADPNDAAALEAYRQQALRYRESITGWKPLVFWYGFWMIAFGIGTISALFSGEVGVFFVGLVITGLLFLYTRYLFRGGTRRVWFFIF